MVLLHHRMTEKPQDLMLNYIKAFENGNHLYKTTTVFPTPKEDDNGGREDGTESPSTDT